MHPARSLRIASHPHLTPDPHRGYTYSYNSITGEVKADGGILDTREYIIYSPGQAMPCYVVWYKKG